MTFSDYDNFKENKQHGEAMLPLAVYHVVIENKDNILACHWHDEIEIIYLAAGKAAFTLDEATYVLRAGDCIFVNGGQIHTGFGETDYVEYYSVVFSTYLLTNPFDACRVYFDGITTNTYCIMPHLKQDNPVHSKVIGQLRAVIEELENKGMAYELAVKSRLFSFFSIIFREKLFTENKGSQKILIHSPRYDLLKKILGYIYSNYNKKINLKDISDYVDITPQYLCVFFKEMTRTRLTDYINRYRIDAAVNLLKASRLSITEIALECGFETSSYFNRVFKKQLGCTPSCYRASNR